MNVDIVTNFGFNAKQPVSSYARLTYFVVVFVMYQIKAFFSNLNPCMLNLAHFLSLKIYVF